MLLISLFILFAEEVIPNIDSAAVVWVGKENSTLPAQTARQWVDAGRIVIANVPTSCCYCFCVVRLFLWFCCCGGVVAPCQCYSVRRLGGCLPGHLILFYSRHSVCFVPLQVMNGRHFVLVVGYSKTVDGLFYVNDPGFDRDTYNYSDIVGWRIFDMKQL